MGTVIASKAIHPGQLVGELGASVSIVELPGGMYEISADIPQETLQAAIDTHVAVDEDGNRTRLMQQARQAMAINRTYLARTSPTAAQNTAQVKALTQQCEVLIRLAVGDLTGTD